MPKVFDTYMSPRLTFNFKENYNAQNFDRIWGKLIFDVRTSCDVPSLYFNIYKCRKSEDYDFLFIVICITLGNYNIDLLVHKSDAYLWGFMGVIVLNIFVMEFSQH